MNVQCPECRATLSLEQDTVEGEIIACAECGAELEVVAIQPLTLTLALAPDVGEDWG